MSWLLALSLATPLSPAESRAISLCAPWIGPHVGSNQSGRVRPIPSEGLCYDGAIDQKGGLQFIALLKAVPKSHRPIVVIRSRGGDVKIGLNMADAVLARRATVIAYDYCISSCANYIFGGAARRIVFHDAILGFHGGATYIPREDILADFKKAGVANPVEATRNALVDLNRTIYRQNRFLKAAGIDTHFFQWVDAFNHLPEERRKAICGEEADFFVFSSAFLKSYGFSIAVNEGPHSPTELKTALKGIKAPPSIACYVGIKHRTL